MPSCSIPGCDGKKRCGVKMFMFPKINHQTETFKELSKQRQQAWMLALSIFDGHPESYEKLQVCDSHFISGKMASLQDTNNLDWIPTMNLNCQRNSSSHVLRCSIVDCMVSNQGGQCSFYRIRKNNEHGQVKQISENKQLTWLSALPVHTDEYVYVCHAHYIIEISGKLRNALSDKTICLDLNNSSESLANSFKSNDCNVISKALSSNGTMKAKRSPRNQRASSTTTDSYSLFFKSGEILRDERGTFAFSCGYCDIINDDFYDILTHITKHFDGNTENTALSTSPKPLPEFVSCATTEMDIDSKEISPEADVFATKFIKPLIQVSRKRSSLTKPNIEDLAASRPCKIQKIVTTTTPEATSITIPEATSITIPEATSITIPEATSIATPEATPITKWKLPIRIPPMPISQGKSVTKTNPSKRKKRSSADGWCFGRNYEIIYKNGNASVDLTLSKDLKDNGNDASKPEILRCSQCMKVPPVGETDPRRHKCRECSEWFPNHVDYRTHFLETHRSQTSNRCYQCEMEPAISNESDPRRHKCVICQEWFPNHVEFKTHLKDVHDEDVLDKDFTSIANDYKEFTCYICENNLKQREYLCLHMKGHFQKYLEYQCHLCGLRLRTESSLKEHMKRHVSDPTECDLCNKVFSNPMRMKTHRMCHTDDLNYRCTVCSKGFKLSKYLNRHMAVHNEVKISCRYCDASFRFSTGRRAHEKSQHNVL